MTDILHNQDIINPKLPQRSTSHNSLNSQNKLKSYTELRNSQDLGKNITIDPSQVDQAQEEEHQESISKPQLEVRVERSGPNQSENTASTIQTEVYTPAHAVEDLHSLHSKVDNVLRRSIVLENSSKSKQIAHSALFNRNAQSQSLTFNKVNEILARGQGSYKSTDQLSKIYHVQELRDRKSLSSLKPSTYLIHDQTKLDQIISSTAVPKSVQSATLSSHSHEINLAQISECLARSPLKQNLGRSTSQQKWTAFEKEKTSPYYAQSSTLPSNAKYISTRSSEVNSHQQRIDQISECLARSPLRQDFGKSLSQQIKRVKSDAEVRTQPFKGLKIQTEVTKPQPQNPTRAEKEKSSNYGDVENDRESMIIEQNEIPEILNDEAEQTTNQKKKEQFDETKSKEKKLTKRQEIINARKNLRGSSQDKKAPNTEDKKDKKSKDKQERPEVETSQPKNKNRDELIQSPTKLSIAHDRLFGSQKARGGSQV